MGWIRPLAFGALLAAAASPLWAADTLSPPADLTSAQEHQREMDLLHLPALRLPARDLTHPQSPVLPVYDEDKAAQLSTALPDPLVMQDGTKVKTAAQWWSKRRPELMALFERDILGKRPAHLPRVRWTVTDTIYETVQGVAVVTRRVTGHVDNSTYPLIAVDIRMDVTTPAAAQGKRVPLIVTMNALGPPPGAGRGGRGPAPPAAGRAPTPPPQYPDYRKQILERGWGYAIYDPVGVQADNGAGLSKGIIGLVNRGQPRGVEDWGVLSAWGWGASRALDYLATDHDVDSKRIGLFGHSRFGKAAIVTMMYDPRFAVGYISSSGKGGAAPYRRMFGATVENMASPEEFHWQGAGFLRYAADPLHAGDLPVDANEAIAMIAPRAVFVSAGKLMLEVNPIAPGDSWVDGKGSFEATAAAGPVYRLLGQKGLGSDVYPPLLTLADGGKLAFRQHDEGHTPNPNWSAFLDFAARQFKRL